MFMAMRRCTKTTTGLLSVVLAACGSSSSGAVSSEDAGREGPLADATAGSDVEARREADGGIDAPEVADAAPIDDSSPAPPDAAADSSADAGESLSVYATFYGWADNSPPGGAIAYPKSDGNPTVHETAGGSGTYADPITFATDKAELPVGTLLYVPFIEKYVDHGGRLRRVRLRLDVGPQMAHRPLDEQQRHGEHVRAHELRGPLDAGRRRRSRSAPRPAAP